MSESLKTMPDGSHLNGFLCPGYTRCPALRNLILAAAAYVDDSYYCLDRDNDLTSCDRCEGEAKKDFDECKYRLLKIALAAVKEGK